ncbi:MAG: hypothetical protein R3293_04090 [Candidatus Promineifilaceae bacterium]|nr:hypothetical protein [Candidatus Promineifilaceae bacterium]
MSSNNYHFITQWRMRASVEEIADILGNGPDLVRWWPSVYLDVQELEPGDENGVGKVVGLYTKGWLPYTLRWQFRISENRHPYGFSLEAWGDFVGRGIWTFTSDGEYVDVTYDWLIKAEKPLLRTLSFILKPLFGANHQWAMKKGRESLELELARRRARTEAELAAIPPPPGPTFGILMRKPRETVVILDQADQ